MSPTTVEMAERAAAVPPALISGAYICGVPVADITAWLMLGYTVSLVLWHLKTKWLKRWWP